MSETASYGRRMAQPSVVKVLKSVLPNASFDLERVAVAIIEQLDADAIEIIEEREQGMQKALVATMDYLGGVVRSQRERIDVLEAEVTRLTLELAKS